mgnify:FL=1
MELDLDQPENDRIEIKNYKTKFEDLFTSIVAQTEAMKKSAYAVTLAAQAFTSTGDIKSETLQNSVMKADLSYAFDNGQLTIDDQNGIWGVSDSGVVAMRGGGIFTATEKDSSGNWKWNTGIVPQGINADLISTGQLDTNRVNIFAGDKIRFQLNGEGLFAYKDLSDLGSLSSAQKSALEEDDDVSLQSNGLDLAQYVVMNQDGLFLKANQGALLLTDSESNGYRILDDDVTRVEISWDGLKLRNWDNDEVFWADADTGNLTLKGTVYANGLFIGDSTTTLSQYLTDVGTNLIVRLTTPSLVANQRASLNNISLSDGSGNVN